MAALNAKPASFDHSAQHRRGLIAKIHVAKKQLAMSEDDYRQILFDETGRTSLTECSEAAMEKMVARLKAVGFRPLPKSGKGAASHPMARKARALWISLYHLGVVRSPSEASLEAFAKRQLGCERLVWAQQSHAYRLIEALKDMAERNGWKQTDPNGSALGVLALNEGLCLAILDRLKAKGVADPDWTLNIAGYRLTGFVTENDAPYTVEDYGRLAKALGDVLRDEGGAS